MTVAQESRQFSKQTRIGVLYGGLSSERDVSLRSGKNCAEALQRLGYEHVILIDANRQVATQLEQAHIEVAFLALHGTYGEDGCIQGLLEYMGLPYTGNRLTTSAITMDKALTKTLLAQAGLPVLPSVVCQTSQEVPTASLPFDYPMIVKPLCEGSSVGMSKLTSASDWPVALENLRQAKTERYLIEPFITGPSITVGVIEKDARPVVLPILEMKVVSDQTDWYDTQAKYTEGWTELVCPAPLEASLTQAIQATTLQAHQVLGCHGVSRTDFVIDAQTQRYYILEVNTIPGMTTLSDLPAQAKAAGIDYDTLVELILKTAC